MRIGNYVLECHTRARHKYTHFRIHRRPYYSHLVWGRLSLLWGQPHLEPVTVCAECGGDIRALSTSDETWHVCEDCMQVEGQTCEITTEEYEARS